VGGRQGDLPVYPTPIIYHLRRTNA
jgi:hypothetical protein